MPQREVPLPVVLEPEFIEPEPEASFFICWPGALPLAPGLVVLPVVPEPVEPVVSFFICWPGA